MFNLTKVQRFAGTNTRKMARLYKFITLKKIFEDNSEKSAAENDNDEVDRGKECSIRMVGSSDKFGWR